jgi:hypothetical protein
MPVGMVEDLPLPLTMVVRMGLMHLLRVLELEVKVAAEPASTVVRKGKLISDIRINDTRLILSSSHNKADCPNPRVQKCRHCNEEGHIVRDCPTAPPREFTGECHHCHEEGHMAKDCPTKPAEVCRNCQEEGK